MKNRNIIKTKYQAFNIPKHQIDLNNCTHQLDSHFLSTLYINSWNKQKHQNIKKRIEVQILKLQKQALIRCIPK